MKLMLLTMRLAAVLLIAATLQIHAEGHAQKISLSEKNASLQKVFKAIQKQSGFHFFYKDELLSAAGKVDIEVRNASIEETLDQCLRDLPLTYSIIEKTIIIKQKAALPPPAVDLAPTAEITGVIKDQDGRPLAGVNIRNKRTGKGTATNAEGRFSITASTGDELEITSVGYQTETIKVSGAQQTIDLSMKVSASELENSVVIAYGTQKKKAVTGAVSSVTNAEIVTTKNENLLNTLTGKIAGLRVIQNTAEPGNFDNTFNIRGLGNPLIVVDGVPRDNIMRLDPNDIESVSILKDASAAVYGVRSANGVVLVTTKRGRKGTLALTYSGNYGWQIPSGLPKPLDAIGYMTLVNQQKLHNVNGGVPTYTQNDFDAYKNGSKKSYDWYNAVIAKSFPQTQHTLTASGGNDNTTYFLSVGYMYQDGMLKSGDLNYKRFSVRSNITSRLTNRITLDLNINGILDTKNQPNSDAWWIIRSIWRQNPLDPFYANDDPAHLFQGTVDGTNPISLSHSDISGYKIYNNKIFQSSIALTYKLPFIEGLNLKGFYSYDYQVKDNKFYQKQFNQYTYDQASNTYNKSVQNSPSSISREFFSIPNSLSQVSLNYSHVFGGIHNLDALVLLEQSTRSSDNFYGSRQLSLAVDQLLAGNSLNQQVNVYPNKDSLYKITNRGLVGRLNYGFKSRYLAEFSFRYDGSSKFPPAHRWGFFPAASLGWRISEEPFWMNSNALTFINNLKLRASYGKLGDDRDANYQFITGYNYPASGDNNRQPGGSVFDGAFVNALSSTGIPNPNLTWYTSKTFDVGIDAEAWKGLLGFTVDFFNRDRSGLLDYRTLSLPGVVGAILPLENLNTDRTQGFDLEVNHRNHIGKLGYFVKVTFSYSRTMMRYKEQAKAGNSYLNWRNNLNNRYTGIYWAFGDGGRYSSFNDIYNSHVALSRNTLPGDYALLDWNGDGQIDDLDQYPYAYINDPAAPLIQYGITIGGSFKGFDLNLLFQGAAKNQVAYFEQLNTPLWGSDRSSALSQFMDDYHPLDPTADPYDPNTVWVSGHFPYTGTVPPTNSAVNIQNGAYIRLKTVELGYTIPGNILSKIGVKGVRIYGNAYNLFTITKLKYVDPEHPSSTYGYLYPLNKSVSCGAVVNF